ncbi:hypothetical protein PF008_g20158 [Phytophthora fragariae]|uniref:Uncharacterized protein n=1 Tax=Phytophthora fragariae TaxID=53985 RepID=A0A6G0R0A2_9STRA|nr:hypothetical protein PF008_g20158 [Phytophthora fragariae]
MVGLVRFPPLRVDSDLDRRLEGAHDLDTIVHAIAPGANTPPANWDTEMEILRVDVRYHRDQLRECEAWLYKEADLRRQAESLCASSLPSATQPSRRLGRFARSETRCPAELPSLLCLFKEC